jgi:hypothetical protein
VGWGWGREGGGEEGDGWKGRVVIKKKLKALNTMIVKYIIN